MYKFVLMRISGEPRTAISHRNIESWAELKQFSKYLNRKSYLLSVICFRCGEKGHIARNCRKLPRRKESDDNHRTSGNEVRRPEQPPDRLLYSVGCANKERCDYITLELDVSQGRKLHFLVDSGADIA